LSVFSAATPNFRCRIDGCDSANATYADAFRNHFDDFTMPDKSDATQCFQFRCCQITSRQML
jgi:hypothetical protein